MMRKKLRFWTGAAFGAAIQYFYDPKAGQSRRALVRQRITDRMLDAKDGLGNNGGKVGRTDHLRLRRMEPRRTASRVV
jgi:hypothetical protein